jgi:hypothetical protein
MNGSFAPAGLSTADLLAAYLPLAYALAAVAGLAAAWWLARYLERRGR